MIVCHDTINNPLDSGASITVPYKVKAGCLDNELVLAGRDGRREQELGIDDIFGCSRGFGQRVLGFFNAKNEEDEEDRGEELKEGGTLVSP